jgi:uncharacterized protein (DUF58 family)
MELHPTRSTFHVAVAGAGLVAIGVAERLSTVVAYGGAMLLALAVGRAFALVGARRLRAAGFEMVWLDSTRVRKVAAGSTTVLTAELRNRSDVPVRAVAVRPIASSMLVASAEPSVVDLPPQARRRVEIAIQAPRVGRWGVHGLALEARCSTLGGDGIFEVPLHFANPFGVEVVPPSIHALLCSPVGGRARRASEAGRPENLPGNGDELRELRDHAPGDPFKRIAWKASARRGRLLVREMEREERAIVWLVMDTSIELWAGAPGAAPLDRVVDEVGAVAVQHLRRGDRVGIAIVATRPRAWVAPDEGAAHASALAAALASAPSAIDADRSELDEGAVVRRVMEHARPLDPKALRDVPRGDVMVLAQRADLLRARAPFVPRVPYAPTAREASLRQYLAAFGIESPPRSLDEHERAQGALLHSLVQIAKERPRATVVHVWAPPPPEDARTLRALVELRHRRIELRWTLPPFDAGVGTGPDRRGRLADLVDEAVGVRARTKITRAAVQLRRLGIRLIARPVVRKAPLQTSVDEAGDGSAEARPAPAPPPPQSQPPDGSPGASEPRA